MVPIIAYNYGAKKYPRIIKTMRLSITYAMAVMVLGLLIFQFLPRQLLWLFDASPDMMAIGIPALRIISISFIAAGFCIVTLSVLQALGQGLYSLITSASRQLLILVPAAYILSLFDRLGLIWWSLPIAEVASVILCIVFLRLTFKKLDIPFKE